MTKIDLTRKRLLLLAAAAVIIIALLVVYLLGTVLLPLWLSLVIAYVLLPVARFTERGIPWRDSRPGLSRGIAIGVIFLALLGLLAGLLALVVPPTVEQSQKFAEEFPGFLSSARTTVESWLDLYAELIPVEVRDRTEETLSNAGGIAAEAAWKVLSQTFSVISGSFALILGLTTAPVLVFYLMKDSTKIRQAVNAPFPAEMKPHLEKAIDIVDRTIGGYIRGQLTLGVTVAVVVTAGLLLLGVPFPFVLGIVAGITELIPVIGPWIGGSVGVLVTLATAPEKVPWVILLYFAVQIVENVLLVPRIQGNSLNLHPVAIILIIVVASNFFGLWGVILGPPLVAMGKDMAVCFIREWNNGEMPPLTPGESHTAQPSDTEETRSDYADNHEEDTA